jgi:hypothetical protein
LVAATRGHSTVVEMGDFVALLFIFLAVASIAVITLLFLAGALTAA